MFDLDVAECAQQVSLLPLVSEDLEERGREGHSLVVMATDPRQRQHRLEVLSQQQLKPQSPGGGGGGGGDIETTQPGLISTYSMSHKFSHKKTVR